MTTTRICIVWLTMLLAFACQSAASDVTGASQSDDVLHVHLHNATYGQLNHQGEVHDVHARLLQHNSSHSLLHLNSSTAALHKDVLVSNDVVEDLNLGSDPVNEPHTPHDGWSGHEELVATKDGWISSPPNNATVENREAEMAATDQGHQSSVRLFAAVMGTCAGVVVIGGVGVWLFRGRRHGGAALLGDEDEEFTVFSVVDHPYPGKKGDNYSPLP